ncbi:cobalamin B12-binding domain-containing protein [Moritella viscosa]|uniref:cobalamin B12-binding domain-containing protein n=1 Tax=Moritella viscosa TaxID=80854 RepID=UPI00091A5712|nr:cobalamin-dependent protein [Moritella viscosa]SGY90012.1 Methylmalonyl-CoA mutase-like protein [Moritella viscosa]
MKTTSTKFPLRILTATCLFDGHDAAINIVRRLLQARGVEVIHLGINRSVHDVVTAALQEDVDAIAMSSYQGGIMLILVTYYRVLLTLGLSPLYLLVVARLSQLMKQGY